MSLRRSYLPARNRTQDRPSGRVNRFEVSPSALGKRRVRRAVARKASMWRSDMRGDTACQEAIGVARAAVHPRDGRRTGRTRGPGSLRLACPIFTSSAKRCQVRAEYRCCGSEIHNNRRVPGVPSPAYCKPLWDYPGLIAGQMHTRGTGCKAMSSRQSGCFGMVARTVASRNSKR